MRGIFPVFKRKSVKTFLIKSFFYIEAGRPEKESVYKK
jgi:hypothetical protein